MGPTETAVQRALDTALETNRASALSRAGLAQHLDDHEALQFALELLAGLTEAMKIIAAEIDRLRSEQA